MSASAAAARAVREAARGATQADALAAAYEACRSAGAGDASKGRPPERRDRQAALAVAAAALELYGIPPAAERFAPAALTGIAREALSGLGAGEPEDAAPALASIFEGALGANGRRNQGAVYTPPDVVRFMVREGLSARIAAGLELDHDEARAVAGGELASLSAGDRARLGTLLNELRLVDPAVGTGAFLVGAAHEVAALAREAEEAGAPVAPALRDPHGALRRCCHGFEVDPDATRMAEAVLALSCPGADERSLPGVVSTRNTLLGGLGHPSARGGWGLVVMNPPYIGEKHLRRRLGGEFQAALRARDGFAGDLLSHFLLRALEDTREGGALSAIVSDTAFTMASAAQLRRTLTEATTLFGLAWCRPFAVAAQGGVITAIRRSRERPGYVRCFQVDRAGRLDRARGRKARSRQYDALPDRPLFRPSPAASSLVRCWARIENVEELWSAVGTNRPERFAAGGLEAGAWTLLGTAVRGGQGLATGDDRRFVGFVAGTAAAADAARRQRLILEALREDPERSAEWRQAKRLVSDGVSVEGALLALLDPGGEDTARLPGRKPFRIVPPEQVRRTPLSAEERRFGIGDGPAWVPYETSDRSGPEGGARWARRNPVAIEWSAEAVDLLRSRHAAGPKRPVLRHEELWFKGGVTHNRVSSYLRARVLPKQAIFSSESPCYVPAVPWLSTLSLLALLNSPVVEFILKTFLASRNHIELGRVLRLPLPVPSAGQRRELESLARAALRAARSGRGETEAVERELDRLTRALYGVAAGTRLPVVR